MVVTFVYSTLISLLVIYLPGILVTSLAFQDFAFSFCVAPVVAITLYEILAIACGALGIAVSGPFLLLLVLAFAVIIGGLVYFIGKGHPNKNSGYFNSKHVALLALYLLVACAVTTYIYARSLYTLGSFVHSYDNNFHYDQVRVYLESSNWSPLRVTKYPVDYGYDLNPFGTSAGGFYPNAWHILVALVVTVSNSSIALCGNAVNFAFMAFVFPSGIFALFRIFFKEDKRYLLAGAFATVCITAFPWALFMSWPLFPNSIALCLVPCFVAIFFSLFDASRRKYLLALLLVMFCAFVALALAQTNALFTAGVLTAPKLVHLVYENNRKSHAVLKATLVSLVIAAIWLVAFKMPFLQGVVNYYWDPISTKMRAVRDWLTAEYAYEGMHPVAVVMIFIGLVVVTAKKHQYVWTVALWLIGGIIYVAAASFGDEFIKHLLSGFWYTDPYRVAAMAAMCSLPLLAIGMNSVAEAVCILVKKTSHNKRVIPVTSFIVCGLLTAATIYPFSLNFNGVEYFASFSAIRTNNRSHTFSSERSVYSMEKSDFLKQVEQIVGNDAIILNMPYDGSLFGFADSSLNFVYRNISGYAGSSEQEWSVLLRTKADQASSNIEVASVLKQKDIEYVLILEDDSEQLASNYFLYKREEWEGILGITKDTEGFELVLSSEHMSLYRVTV